MEKIDTDLIRQSAELVCKDFDLTAFPDIDYESLLKELTKVVRRYLDDDLNGLLNILYRIDINENEVRNILTTAPPEEMASLLADKILQRELQKAQTRRKHHSDQTYQSLL